MRRRTLALALTLAACGSPQNTAVVPDAAVLDAPAAADVRAGDVLAVDRGAPAADVAAPDPSTRFFPADSPWYRDVSGAPVDAESATVIPWLDAQGFGLGRLQIDFSLEVLEADASAPMRSFTATDDFYEPDCDQAQVPVPAGGALEGESGYACEGDGDCHLLVVHRPTQRLFEMWRANITGAGFRGGCLAVWDMTRSYPPNGRGEQCSSADASGFPIAPLLFSADEVAAGHVDHAIRFILPNARIRSRTYVYPASHATGAASGPASAPPYGARLRLRADYSLASLPTEGARVVARALQRYGMLLADGGNVALTARSDRFSRARWEGLLGPRDLAAIRPRDFEMVDGGTRRRFTGDCVRNR